MHEASLIRSARFRASHHYGRSDWSDEQNRETFGEALRRHEHDYRVEVTVTGPPDPGSGLVADLGVLDRLLAAEVVERLEGRSLNDALPPVAEEGAQPGTEVLARWIFERLRGRIPGQARLRRVRVWESEELGAEVTEG